MTVKEFYNAINGDYEGTLARMLNEARMLKYINKFLAATDYDELVSALADKRYEDAFRFSHNLKGVCLNLGFSRLAQSGSDLCEELRNGPPSIDVTPMLDLVTEDYKKTVTVIKQLVG